MQEKVTIKVYKEKVIEQQGWICAVTNQYIEEQTCELIYVNGQDYAICYEGLNKLRTKYGDKYINDKIIHSCTVTEDQVVRDQG